MGLEEFAERAGEGGGIVEFQLKDGVAERFFIQARCGEGVDGGGKLWREDSGGVPPRHFSVAGGAEADGFGGRKQAHAAGAGGWQDGGEGVLHDCDGGLAKAG